MRRFFICSFFLFCVASICSQNTKNDIDLIKNNSFTNPYFNKKEVSWLFKDSHSGFVKYNPVSLFFGGLMYFYQSSLSPQFSSNCLYSPTCSEFSKKLITRYGLIKGVFLSADRLTRCNSFSAKDIHSEKRNPVSGKVKESSEIYKNRKKDYYKKN